MTQPSTIINSSINQGPKKPAISKLFAILIGASTICCISLFIFEIFPRYIMIDFPPPNHETYGGDWESTIYSVRLVPIISPILRSREFVWRREAIVSVLDHTHGITSWQSIVTYFDNQFGQRGWERTKTYPPCELYLPEANFLPRGENGYVYYRPKGYKEIMDFYGGNFICLAVWNDPDATTYSVAFVTVSQSPLDVIASFGYKVMPSKPMAGIYTRYFIADTGSYFHFFMGNRNIIDLW